MKRILVTGATGGMGEGIAHYLAQLGYNLLLASRNSQKLSALKDDIQKAVQDAIVDTTTIDYTDLNSLILPAINQRYKIDGVVLMTPKPVLNNKLFPFSGTNMLCDGGFTRAY